MITRKGNEIHGLAIGGSWSQDVKEVKGHIRSTFESHFKSNGYRCFKFPPQIADRKISIEENECLIKPFSEDEVLKALKSCGDFKSPGPDGFNPLFFRKSWDVLKFDLMMFLKEFHENGKLTKGLNHSFITLIPKKEASSEIKDFRPISLVGGPYKILSKILANRLGGVLNTIIAKEQSAFVKGRQILDCIAALNGVFENSKNCRNGGFGYKIDFEKAYDSIEWSYLFDICKAFGFCEKWIMWIRECVESAHADVLVNGSPSGDFKLERGLRQGDPLSPFLFIIAAEGIGILMKRAISAGLFSPLVIGSKGLMISHLQFADDTIFLGKPCLENAMFLKHFLQVVEATTGLRINKGKCQVVPIKADPGTIVDIAEVLNCKVEEKPFKYLGVKVGSSHRKVKDWKYVIDKVSNRLCKWSNLKISLGGRITLVNSVLSAMPTYVLSVFRAPRKVVKKLISLQQKFLWGGGVRDRKIVWARWDSLCLPKSRGGFGLRELECFNKALMGKWTWRALDGGDELWLDIIKGCVGKGEGDERNGFDLIKPNYRIKGWWGEVLKCARDNKGDWFERAVVRNVGNGVSSSFWEDRWVGEVTLREAFPRLFNLCLNKSCSVAAAGEWEGERWIWRVGWRREFREWESELMNNLLELLLCRKVVADVADKWRWKLDKSGIFSVKSS